MVPSILRGWVKMDFQTLHRYNTLARRGLVPPMTCPWCSSTDITTVMGYDDEPAVMCYGCNTMTIMGGKWFDELKAKVEEIG